MAFQIAPFDTRIDNLPVLQAAEPPVVARLIVEIRSDGTTTIARGGLTDASTNETTVIEARGSTPLALAISLSRHLVGMSSGLGFRAARALLGPGRRSTRR